MVHQPSGGFSGQASDIAIHAKEIMRVRGRLNEIYRRHLGQARGKEVAVEEIERMMERDCFLDAGEAKEVGIVDNIYTTREGGKMGEGEG